MYSRWVEALWKTKFGAPYVHLVFGARQSRPVIRAMGRYRVVETPAIPGRRQAPLPTWLPP